MSGTSIPSSMYMKLANNGPAGSLEAFNTKAPSSLSRKTTPSEESSRHVRPMIWFQLTAVMFRIEGVA